MKTKLSIDEKAALKLMKAATRKHKKEQAKIEAEKNQKPVKEITITVEWKRSQMWGSNPNCEAEITFKDGSFERSPVYKCSGCGYDKLSTVVADVFNDYLKYKLYGELPQNLPYGMRADKYKYYDGGIGINCYDRISTAIGGEFHCLATGKTFDVYKYTEKE
jgi:transposase-like protein